jgi:signal peptidase I
MAGWNGDSSHPGAPRLIRLTSALLGPWDRSDKIFVVRDLPASPLSHPRIGTRPRSWRRELFSVAVLALGLFAARSSLADHYFVPTGSMVPTVAVGDRVVVSKLAYSLRVPFTDVLVTKLGEPAPGDVVVLRSPESGITLLKRIVAVPGDEVAVFNGRLWINGRPAPLFQGAAELSEQLGDTSYPIRMTFGGGPDYGPVQVGRDQFLVLGDNRGESHDGRAFGLVERQAVVGKALGIWMREGRLTWRGL